MPGVCGCLRSICHKAPRFSAEQILICLTHLYIFQILVGNDSKYPAVPEWQAQIMGFSWSSGQESRLHKKLCDLGEDKNYNMFFPLEVPGYIYIDIFVYIYKYI